VPQEQKAGWASFVKSLAQMTGDLSSMTAPPCECGERFRERLQSALCGMSRGWEPSALDAVLGCMRAEGSRHRG
jgi:hypothetical protein